LIELFKFVWRSLRDLISPTSIKEIDRRISEQLEWHRILTNEKASILQCSDSCLGFSGFCASPGRNS
jgi:hypothetical protein